MEYPHPGDIIKRARENAGLTQEVAARRTGVPLSSYRKYEQGKVEPPYERVRAILDTLSVTSFGERVHRVHEESHLPLIAFAENLGAGLHAVRAWFELQEPENHAVAALMKAYPTLNEKWLMGGSGDMYFEGLSVARPRPRRKSNDAVEQQLNSVRESTAGYTDAGGDADGGPSGPTNVFHLVIETDTSTVRIPCVAVGAPEIIGPVKVKARRIHLDYDEPATTERNSND